jgi:catechol 2,3-dioxygenase-like lactoylglutathione lyase family enzyme
MMIKGISHITLVVKDLNKSSYLLRTVLNAEEMYSSDNGNLVIPKEKILVIGGVWIALVEGDAGPRSYNHIAFEIDERNLPLFLSRIQTLNLEILKGRPRHPDEGKSLYFYDYDNHLFELHAGSLSKRLGFYKTIERKEVSKNL